MDNLTPSERSDVMSRVGTKNTRPEIQVRKLLYRLGYRYRLHDNGLPGRPDVVFAGRRKLVFVNGCFWHRHHCKLGIRMPKSRVKFWKGKFDATVRRDRANRRKLHSHGWSILTVWECQIKDARRLEQRLTAYLGPPRLGDDSKEQVA